MSNVSISAVVCVFRKSNLGQYDNVIVTLGSNLGAVEFHTLFDDLNFYFIRFSCIDSIAAHAQRVYFGCCMCSYKVGSLSI